VNVTVCPPTSKRQVSDPAIRLGGLPEIEPSKSQNGTVNVIRLPVIWPPEIVLVPVLSITVPSENVHAPSVAFTVPVNWDPLWASCAVPVLKQDTPRLGTLMLSLKFHDPAMFGTAEGPMPSSLPQAAMVARAMAIDSDLMNDMAHPPS
jgi:hypothetical protein